jgi:hypothetical protein
VKISFRIDKKWQTISGFMLLEVPPSKIQNLVVKGSVADPGHLGADPDPHL